MKNYLKLIALFVFLIPFTGNAESSISNDCYTFTKYLSVDVGVSSADVAALKKVLIKEKIIDSNFKSTVYDENFASAVIDFQTKYKIQKTGTVGPITRAKLNGLYGCSNNSTVNTKYSPTYSPSYSPTYKSTPTSIPSADKKIEVLTPTNSSGVNSFEPGNTIKFNWSQSGIKGVKKIILVSSNGNDNIYVLNLSSISNPLTTGTYNWIVPSSVKAGMYRVRIISDTGDLAAESSGKIVIRNSSPVTVQKEADKVSNSTASYSSTYTYTPSSTYTYTPSSTYTEKPKVEVVKSVTVLTPSGANGNKFNRGESMKIAWSSTGVRGVSLIKLISSTNSNATHTVLDLTSPNSFPLTTDSYSWTIPTSINSGEYYVYVQIGNDSTAISNKSSGKITILEK